MLARGFSWRHGVDKLAWPKPRFPAFLGVCDPRICLEIPLESRPHISSRAYAYPSASPHRSNAPRWSRNINRSTHRLRLSASRSEEHTSELQSLAYLVCRLL